MTGHTGAGPTEVALRLLANRTRRALLRHLLEAEGDAVSSDDLAAALAEADDRRDVAIALHHFHLPMLSEAGVVEWEPDAGTVRYSPSEPLDDLLRTLLPRGE